MCKFHGVGSCGDGMCEHIDCRDWGGLGGTTFYGAGSWQCLYLHLISGGRLWGGPNSLVGLAMSTDWWPGPLCQLKLMLCCNTPCISRCQKRLCIQPCIKVESQLGRQFSMMVRCVPLMFVVVQVFGCRKRVSIILWCRWANLF